MWATSVVFVLALCGAAARGDSEMKARLSEAPEPAVSTLRPLGS